MCLTDIHDTEIKARIRKGWAKFNQFKTELCDKTYSLTKRLKLSNAVVTPMVLYGSSSWTMTCERERTLRIAQRKMLRNIIGEKRLPEEKI